MPWQSAISSVSNPARSPPNSRPTRQPWAAPWCSATAASRGVITGSSVSRGRAVVASVRRRSATAASTRSNPLAPSSGQLAPEALAQARSCGQPSRGATSRSSESPKLAITRATAPMFSASCGWQRMTTGAWLEGWLGAWLDTRHGIGRARSQGQPGLGGSSSVMTFSRRQTIAIAASAALAACQRKLSTTAKAGPMDTKRLDAGFPALADRARPGAFAIGVMNLASTATWYWNTDRSFPLAGAAALPIAVAAMAQIDQHKLALNEQVAFTSADLSPPPSLIDRSWPAPPGGRAAHIPAQSLITLALREGDTTAMDVLTHRIGGPGAVSGFLDQKGVTGLRVDRYQREIGVEMFGMPTFRADWKDMPAFAAARDQVPAPARTSAMDQLIPDPRDSSR